MENYLIDLDRVSVCYPQDTGGLRTVIDNVSLRVREGEFVTIVGPSGCGKSTLLRMVLGSQPPTTGTTFVAGKKVERVTRDCGIVYQTYSLFPHLTVRENIGIGIILGNTNLADRMARLPLVGLNKTVDGLMFAVDRTFGTAAFAITAIPWLVVRRTLPWKLITHKPPTMPAIEPQMLLYYRIERQAREMASQLLLDVGLDIRDADKYPHELSGGMRQRVACAQALITRPKILLMDEPFGALDQTRRQEMQDFIHDQWSRHHLTIFFVTHDLEEAVKLGTRVLCLSQHWREQSGKQGNGSKIVVDRKGLGGVKPSEIDREEELESVVAGIEAGGLKSSHIVTRSDFDLSHTDAVAV